MHDSQSLTYRAATLEDAQAVFELIARCESAEYGAPDTDLDDVLQYWNRVDIATRTRVALAADGSIVGYAAVLPWGDDLNYEFYADPGVSDSNIAAHMLDFCIATGPTVIDTKTTAHAVAAHVNKRDIALLRDAAFEQGSFYHQMQFEADEKPSEPEWPTGVTVRQFQPGVDDKAVHHVVETAFFRPDRTPTTLAAWREFMLGNDSFDASLWFLAVANDTIIGVSLCYNFDTRGWVRQLCVLPEWQGKGIGGRLLQYTFGRFYERGVTTIGLSVDSKRPDAHRFYQRVGMTQVRQYDEFIIEVEPRG
jgi:GNAT superfamily N-acetyltransferase